MSSPALSDESRKTKSMRSVNTESTQPRNSFDFDADENLDLPHALRAAFSSEGNPEQFLARVAERKVQVEASIIETCAKNRTRTDDNLYALLESRDAITEQVAKLDKSMQTASQVTSTVNSAVARLTEKTRIRKNLDAALAVAAQTRKLTRMYARIEDTIDSRRLYTALRMLKVLEEETKNIQPGTVLEELIPDTQRLRSQIEFHARKSFVGWLPVVSKFEHAIGAYALQHATIQALSHEQLLEHSRASVVTDTYLLPHDSAASPRLPTSVSKPWTPVITPNATPPEPPFNRRSIRAFSIPGPGIMSKLSFGSETITRPDIGVETRRSYRASASDRKEDIPMLYLRPLLQSVLVNDGLGNIHDFRSDYRRERHTHLQRLLAEGEPGSEGPPTSDLNLIATVTSRRAAEIDTVVCKVCGFFVVERAVELNASNEIVPRSTVDDEWWPRAFSHLQGLLRGLDENSFETSPDKARARSMEDNILRFAQANYLPM